MADLGKTMAFILYCGAARASARGQQLQHLRATVLPLLQSYRDGRADEETIRLSIKAVMGPNWEPSGDWKLWIDRMESKA